MCVGFEPALPVIDAIAFTSCTVAKAVGFLRPRRKPSRIAEPLVSIRDNVPSPLESRLAAITLSLRLFEPPRSVFLLRFSLSSCCLELSCGLVALDSNASRAAASVACDTQPLVTELGITFPTLAFSHQQSGVVAAVDMIKSAGPLVELASSRKVLSYISAGWVHAPALVGAAQPRAGLAVPAFAFPHEIGMRVGKIGRLSRGHRRGLRHISRLSGRR